MPDPTPDHLKDQLIAEAKALGFDAVGVAAVEDDDQDRSRLFAWLARGYHASMAWMARDPERRADVRRSLPGARSVISLAINYHSTCNHDDGCGSLKVSRYAWGEDYHRVVSGKLKHLRARLDQLAPGSKSITCVDTGPVMERAWAERAGIGWIGRNGSLITRDFGSWVFLAEIVTTAELPADKPHADFCGSCGRCIEACPTEAFVEPYVIDAN
ncbi:MAG TPA: tRNA epoxyqueuosine(34) reductase QueG, partial [Acidobacteriota bacterium]|nr:tRNA epoxyqueuosine(34) reductase QueG [Acidobacteriota bacterium]